VGNSPSEQKYLTLLQRAEGLTIMQGNRPLWRFRQDVGMTEPKSTTLIPRLATYVAINSP
jgi:hypothetical protein